jgi:hypothetical protein
LVHPLLYAHGGGHEMKPSGERNRKEKRERERFRYHVTERND